MIIEITTHKLILLVVEILLFSVLYYLMSDEEFGGINVVQELIREEIVKRHIEDDIEGFQTQAQFQSQQQLDSRSQQALEQQSQRVEQDTRKQIKEVIRPPPWQDYFNRLYFSAVTGTTVGYGDIYPISNRCKVVVLIQLCATLYIVSR